MIDVLQADAILYTEMIFSYQSPSDIEYPTKIDPKHIRAAHIYNIAFTHVRQNFEIAGLLPLHQVWDNDHFHLNHLYKICFYFIFLFSKMI